jgi:hypothetical protein
MSWSDESDLDIAPVNETAPKDFYDSPIAAPGGAADFDDDDDPLILPNEALDASLKPRKIRITRKFDIDLYVHNPSLTIKIDEGRRRFTISRQKDA